MDNISKIAEWQDKVQAELKKQTEYLGQIDLTIKKLRNDKVVIQANIAKLEGAAQAYAESALIVRDTVRDAAQAAYDKQVLES